MDINKNNDLKKLEAILFVSGRFLNMREIISFSGLNPTLIRELISQLKSDYDSRNSSIQIVEKEDMWKMDIKQEYSYIVNMLATGSSEFSKAEQETLAIVAFKHPMKQSVLIKIRGNKAYDHIKKFNELGLVKKKKLGHTHELTLSENFYDYFNTSKKDLKQNS